jgi:hypothetical protein
MSGLLLILFMIACVVGVVLQIGVIIVTRRRNAQGGYEQQVYATVMAVKRETTFWTSGWSITASWSDTQTGQSYTFRSPLVKSPPSYHAGEVISVLFDPKNPLRFRMEL